MHCIYLLYFEGLLNCFFSNKKTFLLDFANRPKDLLEQRFYCTVSVLPVLIHGLLGLVTPNPCTSVFKITLTLDRFGGGCAKDC